ncbi:uncharacterized protein CCOS01_01542 [Colletotrichum costaricense]|uniref:Uncharacterized protein n=1 Tax=Colletotrichum costaricense TaxID=1209916 RepID=A0AAJ0E925_9PEZI|nr:uncharacterized protein CCOS01_01542 [Colletotrichum costaricense]KAK1540228.1 hypothetical protein CCOS01_01542 [Colletotrichum costaricense]
MATMGSGRWKETRAWRDDFVGQRLVLGSRPIHGIDASAINERPVRGKVFVEIGIRISLVSVVYA